MPLTCVDTLKAEANPGTRPVGKLPIFRVPTSVGTVPLNIVAPDLKPPRFVRRKSSVGIVPLNELLKSANRKSRKWIPQVFTHADAGDAEVPWNPAQEPMVR